MSGANLSYADLGGASFLNTDLEYANLTGANLRRCDFEAADFTGAILKNVQGIDELFITSIIVNGKLLSADLALAWIVKQAEA